MPHFSLPYTPLWVILPAYIALALVYAWATPPLEASDELWHVGMVDHLADTGSLPVQNPAVTTAWEQEGSQPPLYYLMAAALVAPLDRTDFDTLRQPNPHVKAGIPGDSDNKNLVLHDPAQPFTGTTAAIYLVRLFSIALGCVTVAAVYQTAREIGLTQPLAIFATGITAYNPMFLFISASVNNDTLVTALNSVIIWQTVVMLKRGFDTRRSLVIAVLVALATLSKLSALVLVPVIALAALWLAVRNRQPRALVVLGASMAGAWLVIAGWWYLRNILLYGELFGTHRMVAVAGPRFEPFTLATALSEFEGFRIAYWGLFGAVNVLTVDLFYRVMDIVTVIALAGIVIAALTRPPLRQPISVLGSIVVIGFAAFLSWTAQTYASQGRLLFPFVAALSPLLGIGLAGWGRLVGQRLMSGVGVALVVMLAGFAGVVPFLSIAPVYRPPQPLSAPPVTVQPVYADFDAVTLVGYETPDRRYEPGDQIPITVYWQANRATDRDLSLYLHAVDPDGSVIGRIDSFPGGGTLRTSTWQPGAIYADSYRIPLDDDLAGRFNLRVQVGWWHFASGDVIAPRDETGALLESVMLHVGAFGEPESAPLPADFSETVRIIFGDMIALRGYHLDDSTLELVWESVAAPDGDYTVFVQVLDADSNIITQGDAPPTLPTRYWQPGETVTTRHMLTLPPDLPPGDYRVLIGWYRLTDFARLATDAPDHAHLLTTITLP